MKIKFYNNWKDYLKSSSDYKGYFALIPFAFYSTNPNYIIVIFNFSIILKIE